MLKSFYKMTFFAICNIFLFAGICSAQQMEAMSGRDFAKKYAPDVGKYFDDEDAGVMCGNRGRICKKDQVCLRCTTTTKRKIFGISVISGVKDIGKCVDRASYNPNDVKASWSECDNTKIDATLLGTGVFYEKVLSAASEGFVSDSEFKILGIGYKHKEEVKGNDGKKYRLISAEGKVSMAYGGNDFENCEVLPVKIYKMQSCFFCPMAKIVFNTVNNATRMSFATFAPSFMEVIVVVYAVWLALATLQQVFSFSSGKDVKDYLEKILIQSFKFMIAYFLLMNSTILFQWFISPVLVSGLKMGKAIQSVELKQPSKEIKAEKIAEMPTDYYNMEYDNGNTLYKQIETYLSSLQSQMAYMQAVGTTLFCVGTRLMTLSFRDLNLKERIKDGFRMMFLGAFLMMFGVMLSLVFAFYFLEAILQLGFLGMMMPFMIACWPFAITKKYSSKGLDFLLNTFFVFFFTGFVLSVNVVLIDQALSLSAAINSQGEQGGLHMIAQTINEQNIEKLRTITEIGGLGFLLLVFSSLFGFKFMEQVNPLASKLSSGAMKSSMAASLGGLAASQVKGMATKATAPAMKKVSDAYNKQGGIVGMASSAVGSVANKASDALSAAGLKTASRGLARVGRGAKRFQGVVADLRRKKEKK